MMSDRYESAEALLRDYYRLSTEYRYKVDKYIRNLMRIQRAENGEKAQIGRIERMFKKERDGAEYICNFCGRTEAEAHHMIMGPGKVVICDECVKLCEELMSGKDMIDVEIVE